MVLIPAGSFEMGDHLDNMANALPVHMVELDAFYMDIHEVTVGQYKQFVSATGHRSLPSWVSGYSPTDNRPMLSATWDDAIAYAQWAGKRLPTEAEWEYAARGGLIGKRYPWGDELTHDDANYSGTDGKDEWDRSTAPVGSFEPNNYGLYDMAGNVWEFCQDWYDSNQIYRVLRGGSWNSYPYGLRAACRYYINPPNTLDYFGFRCVSGF